MAAASSVQPLRPTAPPSLAGTIGPPDEPQRGCFTECYNTVTDKICAIWHEIVELLASIATLFGCNCLQESNENDELPAANQSPSFSPSPEVGALLFAAASPRNDGVQKATFSLLLAQSNVLHPVDVDLLYNLLKSIKNTLPPERELYYKIDQEESGAPSLHVYVPCFEQNEKLPTDLFTSQQWVSHAGSDDEALFMRCTFQIGQDQIIEKTQSLDQ